MRHAGLLRDRRDAQWVLYSLAPDMPDWARAAVAAGVAALATDRQHAKDRKRLRLVNRPARVIGVDAGNDANNVRMPARDQLLSSVPKRGTAR